jgi:NarL family two-component system response regulator LiaR
MMSTAFAPAIRTGTDPRQSVDTGLELVSRAHAVSSRVTVRVLIANQQPIVRHGLRALIASEPDVQVVGEADDGGVAVRMARQLRPDVVLIDQSIPTVDGISATRMIRAAGSGQVALPAQTAAQMVRLIDGHDALSHRQTEILRLVARGLPNKQVARELGITESTVKTHVGSILSKLGLDSRTQLALYAARTGLVALHHLSNAASPCRT